MSRSAFRVAAFLRSRNFFPNRMSIRSRLARRPD